MICRRCTECTEAAEHCIEGAMLLLLCQTPGRQAGAMQATGVHRLVYGSMTICRGFESGQPGLVADSTAQPSAGVWSVESAQFQQT